ncbi:MAG: prolipoprotein diacylglyceryl transferase [Clostridia bacterium]|nr:prolipoprotein diacylglyceryl transferase [Clostridia bacterium]
MFTLYGALAALSLAALLATSGVVLKKRGAGYDAFIRFAVVCVPLAFLGSRIAFCLSNLSYYLETISMPEMMLHVQDGGASMTGAMVGVILAAVIAARWCKLPAGAMLDAAAFGMPVALIIERLAEPLCEMGWGKYYQSTAFDFISDLTQGMHPVFAYEAIVAGIILLAMVMYFRKHDHIPGDAMGFFLVLYGCCQTVLESLRNDGHMKVIHFVRINQVAGIAMAAIVLIWWSIRCFRNGGRKEAITSWVTTAVCIGFGVVQEFAADGDENPYFSLTLVSGLLAAALVIVCVAWFFTWKKQGKSAAAIPCVAVATALLLLIERTCDTGDHRLFFVYGIMAANLYIIGHMAFALRKAASKE